ncbi:MAG: GLUG motif-containing protein [Pseudomonadota bacterium]
MRRFVHRTLYVALGLSFLGLIHCSSNGSTGSPIDPTMKASLELPGKTIFSFGSVAIQTSSEKTVTIANAGKFSAAHIHVGSSALTEPFSFKGGSFPGTGGTCTDDSELAPGTSCTAVIVFSPPIEGGFSTHLAVAYNNGSMDWESEFELEGTGAKPCNKESWPFGEGLGTASEPYAICSIEHLRNVHLYLTSQFVLMTDLNLLDEPFSPIGPNSTDSFRGVFDGNGYTISNFRFVTTGATAENYAGFFGYVSGGTLKNIGLRDLTVEGASQVGGLAGLVRDSSVISDAYATGSVKGNGNEVGGLVGNLDSSSITRSHALVTVTSGSASTYVGGLVGNMTGSSSIARSYTIGSATGYDVVGGFVGYMTCATAGGGCVISDSFAAASSTATRPSPPPSVGGFVGSVSAGSSAMFQRSYAGGAVSVSTWAGGFGAYSPGALVSTTDCFFDRDAAGIAHDNVGATAKYLAAMITQITFEHFDFTNVWLMPSGRYPELR